MAVLAFGSMHGLQELCSRSRGVWGRRSPEEERGGGCVSVW